MASPLVWAGATVTFLAWISLLHVPTFPGGRLHVARLGMSEVRTTQTQMLLLFAFALGAVLFSVFTRFSVWSLVLPVILTLTLLMGSDRRWPMVLDDTKPVPEQQHFAMGLVWVLLLLVALPSETPLIAHNDWDADMTLDAPDVVEVVDVEGVWTASINISVLNPSLLDQQVGLDLAIGPGWSTVWDGCTVDQWNAVKLRSKPAGARPSSSTLHGAEKARRPAICSASRAGASSGRLRSNRPSLCILSLRNGT